MIIADSGPWLLTSIMFYVYKKINEITISVSNTTRLLSISIDLAVLGQGIYTAYQFRILNMFNFQLQLQLYLFSQTNKLVHEVHK